VRECARSQSLGPSTDVANDFDNSGGTVASPSASSGPLTKEKQMYYLGSHVSVSGGVFNAPLRAKELEATGFAMSINRALTESSGVKIVIENTAGTGGNLGSKFEEEIAMLKDFSA
jgi:hypothetical protein